MKELELKVKNIECVGCENRIKNGLSQLEEIKKVDASCKSGKVNIQLKKDIDEDTKNKIIDTIQQLDFEIEDI